jgi:hypothetical protein
MFPYVYFIFWHENYSFLLLQSVLIVVGNPSICYGFEENSLCNQLVYYNCLTYGGNSGGAVILKKTDPQKDQTNGFHAIAVHTNGHSSFNSGVLFTKEVEDFILKTVVQFDETSTAESIIDKEQIRKTLQDHQHMLSDTTYQFLQAHLDDLVKDMKTNDIKDEGHILAYLLNFYRSHYK